MPRVNLLPWRDEQRRRRQQRFLLCIGIAVVAGGLGVYAARYAIQAMVAEQRVRNEMLRTEVERLDRQVEELQRLESRKAHLLARMDTIAELQRMRPLAVRLFDELVEMLPAGVQLLEVVQDVDRIVLSNAASGLWPSVADILASEVQESTGYNVYTLLSGMTVETHVLLDAADFVVQQ